MSEHWTSIDGYAGRYEVSDLGRVRSMVGKTPVFLLPRLRDGRYLSVCLYDGNGGKKWRIVHTLVAEAFIGPRAGRQVNHKDGTRTHNALCNLEYCTGSENMRHAHAIGLQCNKGINHSQHKLTEADVLKIRSLAAKGIKQAVIASAFGVDQSTVSKIVARKAWPHIETNVGAADVKSVRAA